ncbi:FAD-dependent monooxygenase [Marinicella sp. S1101]|uniref:FAD-dependent monooxygenase n=1 Tax=Marinicella marina TaxID=2996016 RepID=UPI0022608B1A|nr:FAD-dependent monooxygenase [Marinicella marina]MCX7553776.1 FAD-dependent monooxygenase [Marinicella marina]MDJ1140851.1 FAD-dependent monooxygenase [Marinicella marina]
MPEVALKTQVAIVGGGMVGMALALTLAQNNIESVLLEASVEDDLEQESFDDRTLVINPASKQFWHSIGLWSDIAKHTTEINHVHVSNQGQFGVVHFDKDELKVPQLGHVIAAKKLAQILHAAVKQNKLIKHHQPAKLESFQQNESHVRMKVATAGQSLQVDASLMVAADGVKSAIRTELNLATVVKSYQRQAIICNITTDERHHNRAYERLTTEGPMALLPFKNRFGFVWSVQEEKAASLLAADDHEFLALAQQRFGFRAGAMLKVGRRSAYPLFQIKVPTQYAQRVVLMGNAAHAVSPVSAQGLNLAVRGIDRLSQLLAEQNNNNNDLGSTQVLRKYQDLSNTDQDRTMNYTDDLMSWFKIDEPTVNAIRSLGLVAINANLALKKMLYQTAGGLR